MANTVTSDSIKMAVEITIAGMPMHSGSMVNYQEVVAKFIETIAKKLDELKYGVDGPQR